MGWVAYYLNAYYSGPYLKYSVWEQIKDILPSMTLALVMAIFVFLIGYLPIPSYALLPIQIACGAIIVFGVCETIKMEEYLQIKDIALNILHKQK